MPAGRKKCLPDGVCMTALQKAGTGAAKSRAMQREEVKGHLSTTFDPRCAQQWRTDEHLSAVPLVPLVPFTGLTHTREEMVLSPCNVPFLAKQGPHPGETPLGFSPHPDPRESCD